MSYWGKKKKKGEIDTPNKFKEPDSPKKVKKAS